MDLLSLLKSTSCYVNRPLPVDRVFDSIIPFCVVLTLLIMMSLLSCGPSRSAESALEIKSDSVFASFEGEVSLQHGYAVYRAYGCILCHGVNGEGGVRNRNSQTAEEIPSLTYTAEGFTKDEFRRKVLEGVSHVAKLDSSG